MKMRGRRIPRPSFQALRAQDEEKSNGVFLELSGFNLDLDHDGMEYRCIYPIFGFGLYLHGVWKSSDS